MDRVSSRQTSILQNNLFRTLDCFAIYCQNLIDDAQQRIEGWLDCIPAIDRDVAVKYFLQHFRIRRQSFAVSDEFFQHSLGRYFMRMRCADKVHWDVRVNENHERVPAP